MNYYQYLDTSRPVLAEKEAECERLRGEFAAQLTRSDNLKRWIARVMKERNEARAELAERDAQHKAVMEEKCPGNEVHCTCVPILRREIDGLRGELAICSERETDMAERLSDEQHDYTRLRDEYTIVMGHISERNTECERLQGEIAERDAQHKAVMEEKCPGNEVHCTCVPILRREIAGLQAQLADSKLRRESLFEEGTRLGGVVDTLRAELAEAREQLDRWKDAAHGLRDTIEAQKAELAEAREKASQLVMWNDCIIREYDGKLAEARKPRVCVWRKSPSGYYAGCTGQYVYESDSRGKCCPDCGGKVEVKTV